MTLHNGWKFDATNGRLAAQYNGTEVFDFDANDMAIAQALTTQAISATGAISATTTVTGTTGLIATTGDIKGTTGNVRLGAISAFGTTEPTSWIVFKSGTQPAGAITTSGGLGANDTTVQKIVAGGTINNVET